MCRGTITDSTDQQQWCGACDCKLVEGVPQGRRGGGFLVTGESPMLMISWDDWLPDGSLGRRGGMFEVEIWWKGVPLLSFWEELEVVIRQGTGGVCIEPKSLAWALEFMDRRALWTETELINGRQGLIHGCTVLHHSSLTYPTHTCTHSKGMTHDNRLTTSMYWEYHSCRQSS